jgi:ADP-ribosyl-[dinitrogen reductase] hydrolase
MAYSDKSYKLYDTLNPEALEGKLDRYKHLLPISSNQTKDILTLPTLKDSELVDRAQGCFLGLAIGEAIGSTVEFLPRDSYEEIKDMTGGGPLNLELGEWTDGTAMSICLAKSLLASETVEQYDFMERLQAWLKNGENSARGFAKAVGSTTLTAIESFIKDEEPSAGSQTQDSAGNGSLIRLAPLAIFAREHATLAHHLSSKQSRATHATYECLDACQLLIDQLIDALNGADKSTTLRPRIMHLAPNTLAINGGDWKEKSRDDIRSSAYVIDTLDAALWSVWNTDNFRDAILLAVNLGGDAASVAAVTGQLAGALYGLKSIPSTWQTSVAKADEIKMLANNLFTFRKDV